MRVLRHKLSTDTFPFPESALALPSDRRRAEGEGTPEPDVSVCAERTHLQEVRGVGVRVLRVGGTAAIA